MQCWVSQDMIFDDEQAGTHLREAWEHESGKDEMNVVLQGLEQHFWRGTEAGWLGCYDSSIDMSNNDVGKESVINL